MRTVQDIVNNCLNQLQILRLAAEGHVPEESLIHFDEAIDDAATKLRALGSMEVFAEKPMALGSGCLLYTSEHGEVVEFWPSPLGKSNGQTSQAGRQYKISGSIKPEK